MRLIERLQVAPKVESLHVWNKWLAGIYGVQALVILLLSVEVSVPLNLPFLAPDSLQSAVTGTAAVASGTHQAFMVNIAHLVFAFLLLAAVAHLLLATSFKERYEEALKVGTSRLRWAEYALSGGLMVVTLALLTGYYDLPGLLLLFTMTAGAYLLGLVMEEHNPLRSRSVNWLDYVVGCVIGLLPWLIIGLILWSDGLYGLGAVHANIYWAALSTFILTALIPANLYLQQKKIGPRKQYLYAERDYMIISLVVKTALAWQLFAGVLHS